MPFEEIIDPKTSKSRVRGVDTTSDSYASALALQVRIERADLDDAARLAAIAKVTNLSPEATRARFAEIV